LRAFAMTGELSRALFLLQRVRRWRRAAAGNARLFALFVLPRGTRRATLS
jgi:hypothetical protein